MTNKKRRPGLCEGLNNRSRKLYEYNAEYSDEYDEYSDEYDDEYDDEFDEEDLDDGFSEYDPEDLKAFDEDEFDEEIYKGMAEIPDEETEDEFDDPEINFSNGDDEDDLVTLWKDTLQQQLSRTEDRRDIIRLVLNSDPDEVYECVVLKNMGNNKYIFSFISPRKVNKVLSLSDIDLETSADENS